MSHETGTNNLRRDCPKCGHEIMAAVTKCGFCWTKLDPLAADSPEMKQYRTRTRSSEFP